MCVEELKSCSVESKPQSNNGTGRKVRHHGSYLGSLASVDDKRMVDRDLASCGVEDTSLYKCLLG